MLSRRRGRRIFHPHGVAFTARLEPFCPGHGAVALEAPGPALVRLSRSFGLPEWARDPCGIGLRLPDAYGPGRHQDLLLVSSAAARLGRHALVPSRGFADRFYSSILPYRLHGRSILIGARALAPAPGPTLSELRGRERGELEFELAFASPGGEWQPVAGLRLAQRLPAEGSERLDLDPTNTGGGLELAGWTNRLRGPSYRGSQAGRDAAYARQGVPTD